MLPVISLIVPTRNRLCQLRQFLDSLAQTTSQPQLLEVILVVDEDDYPSQHLHHDVIRIKTMLVPPGQSMSFLNQAGYEASAGRWIMLLNDDVIVKTPGWDRIVHNGLARFPDDLVLVHVNDIIFQDRLCTFPMVSRRFCTLAGGICSADYQRYRIDDHIEDVFNLLNVLGERRHLYLPQVIFEHQNHTVVGSGFRQHNLEAKYLEHDGPLFERFLPERKKLALRLKSAIVGQPDPATHDTWQAQLDAVEDSFALRTPNRLRVFQPWWKTWAKKMWGRKKQMISG